MTQEIIIWGRGEKKNLLKANRTAQSPEADCMSLTLPFKSKQFPS